MSNFENENENGNQDGGPSIGVFLVPNGIGLEVGDGTNTSSIVLSPDDASRVAINFISNVVMFQINHAMRAASERAEIERMRDLITKGGSDVPLLQKK